MITATRYHDISCGHRVSGHESKCAHLHGHNYRFHFTCTSRSLDGIGRVIDFSVMKLRLCQWLEENFDHKFIVWDGDPLANALEALDPQGVVRVDFNPTAENLAKWAVEVLGPLQLEGTGVRLVECKVEETAKCSASAYL